jgi:hypothetical protein
MAPSKRNSNYKGSLEKPIEVFRLNEEVLKIFTPKFRQFWEDRFKLEKKTKQESKLFDLARHYGATRAGLDPIDYKKLVLRLAEEHVRGFQIAEKQGRPPKKSFTREEWGVFNAVSEIMSKDNVTFHRACQLVEGRFVENLRSNGKQWTTESIRAVCKRINLNIGGIGK